MMVPRIHNNKHDEESAMAVYAVTYEYADNTAKLDEIRPVHRAFLRSLYDAGSLVAAGPLSEGGSPAALLILSAESMAAALGILDDDPFKKNDLLASRTARAWNPVTGRLTDLAM